MDGDDGHDGDEDEHIQDTRGDTDGGVDGDKIYGHGDCGGNMVEGGPGDDSADGVVGRDGVEDEDEYDDGAYGNGGGEGDCGRGEYVGEGGQAHCEDDAELSGDGGGRSHLPIATPHISKIEFQMLS